MIPPLRKLPTTNMFTPSRELSPQFYPGHEPALPTKTDTVKSNRPPTVSQAARLRRLKGEYEEQIRSFKATIQIAEREIHADTTAIKNLKDAISISKTTLSISSDSVSSFQSLATRLTALARLANSKVPYEEPDTAQLLKIAVENQQFLQEQTSKKLNWLISAILPITKAAEEEVLQLEAELAGYEMSNNFRKEQLQIANRSLSTLTRNLYEVQKHFNPVRIVPVEVWENIFTLCLDSAHDTYMLRSGEPAFAPHKTYFRLSGVCSTWRRIIIQCRVYNRLYMTAETGLEQRKHAMLSNLIPRFRTPEIFLNLDIKDPAPQPQWYTTPSRRKLPVEVPKEDALSLWKSLSHIKSLTLLNVTSNWVNLTSGLLSSYFGCVPSITLIQPGRSGDEVDVPFSSKLCDVLKLTCIDVVPNMGSVKFNMLKVAHFTLNQPSGQFNSILQRLTSIEVLGLMGTKISIPPSPSNIRFAHLSRLECSPSAFISISSGGITIPSLVSLYLHIPSKFEAEFSLESWETAAQDFVKAVPRLHRFVLIESGDKGEIVGAMVMALLKSFINLQVLEFHKINLSYFTPLLALYTLPNPPKELVLRDCIAIGGVLLGIMKSSFDEDSRSVLHFSKLSIDTCKGLTQAECSEISSLVDSLFIV